MEDLDAGGFLEDGGANGQVMAVHDSEVGAARTNWTTPLSRRPPNLRRQFRTPQAIRNDAQVENSQQPNQSAREGEMESTASSPQPPLPRGRGSSSLPQIPNPTGGRNGMGATSGEPRPLRHTTSPVKVNKRIVRIKRRTSKTTSDVWEYFTQEDTDDGPVAICGFCDQTYQCERGFHGTSTLRSHLLYLCPSCPFTDHEKRRKLSLQDDHRFTAADCRRALAKMIIMDEYPFSVVEGEALICGQSWLRSSPNKIDIRQTIDDLHKYEKLARELGALECGET